MRVPRMRFTVRWMMAAVTVVGSVCWSAVMVVRRETYLEEASQHEVNEKVYRGELPTCFNIGTMTERLVVAEFHARLKQKYERAARYPWLFVAPDPPDPR